MMIRVKLYLKGEWRLGNYSVFKILAIFFNFWKIWPIYNEPFNLGHFNILLQCLLRFWRVTVTICICTNMHSFTTTPHRCSNSFKLSLMKKIINEYIKDFQTNVFKSDTKNCNKLSKNENLLSNRYFDCFLYIFKS